MMRHFHHDHQIHLHDHHPRLPHEHHHNYQIRLLLGDPASLARVDLLTDHVDKLTAEEREVILNQDLK